MFLTRLEGTAKPIPSLPPPRDKFMVLMPTKFPSVLTIAPPEFPGLIAASDWRNSSSGFSVICPLFVLEIIPWVNVCPTPNGLPIARTISPIFTNVESEKVIDLPS